MLGLIEPSRTRCRAAALIMQVPTTFRLLGYPGLAMILFILAAGAGAMLVVQIINHDRSRHKENV